MLRWLPWQGQPLISEREYSLGEVTSWRRSCSSTDTYNMKVEKKEKSAERESSSPQPSAPLLTNAKYPLWRNLQEESDLLSNFSSQARASKTNQITQEKATKELLV